MATNQRPSSGEPDAELPPPRWARGFAWLAAILVLVAGAVAVSFAVDDDGDGAGGVESVADLEAPADVGTFCATAARLGSVSTVDVSDADVSELRTLSDVAVELASTSPLPIGEDFAAVGGALQNVVETVQSLAPDDPTAVAVITESLDRELAAVAAEAERAAAYVEQWCGARPADLTPSAGPTPG